MNTKKVVSLMMAFVFVIGMTAIPAGASETVTTPIHEGNCCEEALGEEATEAGSVQPAYIASCPGGGKHGMRLRSGFVTLFTGTSASNPGTRLFYQGHGRTCGKCGLSIITGQDPRTALMLGYYSILGSIPLYGDGYAIYCGGNYGYNGGNLQSDPYWAGFEWHKV